MAPFQQSPQSGSRCSLTISSAVKPSLDDFADDQDRVTFINRLGSVSARPKDTAPSDAEKHFHEIN
jgi:hypothetical protein